jgi:hypothetical protein
MLFAVLPDVVWSTYETVWKGNVSKILSPISVCYTTFSHPSFLHKGAYKNNYGIVNRTVIDPVQFECLLVGCARGGLYSTWKGWVPPHASTESFFDHGVECVMFSTKTVASVACR